MSEDMINWMKDLMPICRSITGQGTRQTLSYFEKINPFDELAASTGIGKITELIVTLVYLVV